jgi:hypothetical protein
MNRSAEKMARNFSGFDFMGPPISLRFAHLDAVAASRFTAFHLKR